MVTTEAGLSIQKHVDLSSYSDGRFMFDLLNGDLRVREDHSRHDEDQWSWQWVGCAHYGTITQ